MNKRQRQDKLIQVIQTRRISNQHDLLQALQNLNVYTNQATISRDLNDLGISKIRGVYCLPTINPGESALIDLLNIDVAGDNLVIIKTLPGQASGVGSIIDNMKLTEIVGSIAGDDTLFIAVKGKQEQSNIIKHILHHFRRP